MYYFLFNFLCVKIQRFHILTDNSNQGLSHAFSIPADCQESHICVYLL